MFSKKIQVVILTFSLILPIYPSQKNIDWHDYKIKTGDSFYKLFKNHWQSVARFNRMDEKHLIAGMKIKAPWDLKSIKNYEPLPVFLEDKKDFSKFILIDLAEQWLGAYQQGKLIFSAPISSGMEKCLDEKTQKIKSCLTPVGTFSTLAFHRDHVSSIYKDMEDNNIPMPFAIMFFIDKKGVAYWLHEGDLPGRPASHGCVRLTKENAKKLYEFMNLDPDNSKIKWIAKNKKIVVEVK